MNVTRARRPLALFVALALLASCAGPGTGGLSYAEAQSLNPGIDADWVLAEYPGGQVTRGPRGEVQQIRYAVQDPQGRPQTLYLQFDPNGTLREKRYTGRVVRPRAVP